ncbi:hypothetical protein BMETH_1344_1 [methanotrophic bacterial endosymbiont of Bathymodiolus sp.]|nr:hypothetical protein BMETH_1344_1 [methanotrophic bacterial endosymbiont of Bathymodiolus sp.]
MNLFYLPLGKQIQQNYYHLCDINFSLSGVSLKICLRHYILTL